MLCDPTDITSADRVRDERTGQEYRVIWALPYETGTHEAHVQAGIELVTGLV